MRERVIIISDAEARDIAAMYRDGDGPLHRLTVTGEISKRRAKREIATQLLIQQEDAEAAAQLRSLRLYIDFYGTRPAEPGWEPPRR